MDAKAKVVPYEVGGWYRQQNDEWVQLVGVENIGSSYECMYSIDADGKRIHRYTNRPGDYGRVTATPGYSDPRNIPPTIPLTDHEAAMAGLQEQNASLKQYLNIARTAHVGAEERYRNAKQSHERLLTGLEALADALDSEAIDDSLAPEYRRACDLYGDALRRTLASSATGEKNTEEEMK